MAEYLELSPATVSIVLNDAPGAKSIAAATRERILAAAKKLDYRPNTIARSLRMRQTLTIGVIVPELSEGYFTMVMNGVEKTLMEAGYIYMVLCHQGKADLIEEYPRLLLKRSVDGFIFCQYGAERGGESAGGVDLRPQEDEGREQHRAGPRPVGGAGVEAPSRPRAQADRLHEGIGAGKRFGVALARGS